MNSIKHGFILSYYFLLRSIKHNDMYSYFGKALTETIMLGGDTDGNSCIVSGLIGSLVGVKRIPIDMLATLIRFDDKKNGQDREGNYLITYDVMTNILSLIHI